MLLIQNIAVKHERPKQNEERIKPKSCIEQEAGDIGLAAMLEDLPTI